MSRRRRRPYFSVEDEDSQFPSVPEQLSPSEVKRKIIWSFISASAVVTIPVAFGFLVTVINNIDSGIHQLDTRLTALEQWGESRQKHVGDWKPRVKSLETEERGKEKRLSRLEFIQEQVATSTKGQFDRYTRTMAKKDNAEIREELKFERESREALDKRMEKRFRSLEGCCNIFLSPSMR